METNQTPPAPPGWYNDPQMAGTQRYWDGSRWTEHVAPGAAADPMQAIKQSRQQSNLELAGWLTAIFFPIVGFVIGIIVATRKAGEGVAIMLLALVCSLAWVWLIDDLNRSSQIGNDLDNDLGGYCTTC